MKKNKERFLAALDDYKGIIFKVVNSYCNQEAEKQDLAQDIIFQLWRSFDSYDDKYQLSTWIYRVALNVAISYYRKKKVRSVASAPLGGGEEFLEIKDEPQGASENEVLLLQFIDELNELNRALIMLHLDGKSHEEIASIVNISKSNVGTKINRIKKKLKAKFENHE